MKKKLAKNGNIIPVVHRNISPQSIVDARTIKDLLISIQPRYAELIATGSKTIEFRRKFPCSDWIFGKKLWIYSSSPVRAVIAVAEVKGVEQMPISKLWTYHGLNGCIEKETFYSYFQGTSYGYAISLIKVKRLSASIKAKSLYERGFHVPQSYRYVTKDIHRLLMNAYGEIAT